MISFSSWHVGISAEAFAAALFARYGNDVSVQYGANQPEYDLIITSSDHKNLMVSVKGSKDGSWGLTQKYKKNCSYYDAIDKWLNAHHDKTIFCLVQFKGTSIEELPKVYLASPEEIAQRLKESAGGRGETILYENHTWGPRAQACNTTDKIPDEWRLSEERIEEMFKLYGR